jgi:iron complex transport system substrate-binding protein
MIRRREVLGTIGTAGAIALPGCGLVSSTGGDDAPTRTVTDGADRSVEVPETVDRVVAVGPGALRQVAYLGATDRVVGVEDAEKGWATRVPYNQANPELRKLPVIGAAGPNAGGNSEEIIARDPDVILFYGDPSRAESLQSQTETPVVVLRIVDFVSSGARETMFDTWRLVGRILGEADRAETLAEHVRATIDDLEARVGDLPEGERSAAYVGAINYKGAHGIATTRNPFPPFRFVNADNVAKDVQTDAASVQISRERLLAWDPPTMFVSASNLGRVREDLREHREYDRLEAVREDAVYSILPHASYHHNYGSILANAYFVGKTLYPDRFADVSIPGITDDLFEKLLGEPLYDDLVDAYEAYGPLERPE